MRVAIMQSTFLPWRGYIDLIDDVDVFVLFDDVDFSSKSWRNRNKIKTPQGSRWITVPVRHDWPRLAIDETVIDGATAWQAHIKGQITAAYRTAPFFKHYAGSLFDLLDHAGGATSIAHLNRLTLEWLCFHLGVTTRLVSARAIGADGRGEDRVLSLLTRLGATEFINGPSAEAYSTPARYAAAGITLRFKVYDYLPYLQLHGGFLPDMSAIDLLFNTGPEARSYLKSRVPPRPAVQVRGAESARLLPQPGDMMHTGQENVDVLMCER